MSTNPPPLTAAERAAIEAVHYPDPAYNGRVCQACGVAYGRWPCDAHALLATVAALEAERDHAVRELQLQQGSWAAVLAERAVQAAVVAAARAWAQAEAYWAALEQVRAPEAEINAAERAARERAAVLRAAVAALPGGTG